MALKATSAYRSNPIFTQDTVNGIVDTEYKLTEGEVVYVDHIGIEGNTHTKDYVIRREVKLKEGTRSVPSLPARASNVSTTSASSITSMSMSNSPLRHRKRTSSSR